MSNKLRVGIIGGTGMVGQRFITLLDNHPWFEVTTIAASERSAGKTYRDAVNGKWKLKHDIPAAVLDMVVKNAADVADVIQDIDFVFCAVDLNKEDTKALEYAYAKADIPVVSNNSAHRWTEDVPMVIPEVNPEHIQIIHKQRERLGVSNGFIAVKPNCSIQSYVPALTPLLKFGVDKISACTYQAISGAGKTFAEWPEMVDNIIPFIGGEEEKSETEPLKIWGSIEANKIIKAEAPIISTQCIRVPASDGHLAAASVSFKQKPSKEEILTLWKEFKGKPQELELPSAPKQFIQYMEEDNRPQTRLDRDYENGMGVTVGRLREDNLFDYKFVSLSHNTVRGAAGGAVLIAELLTAEGFIKSRA